MKKKEINYIYKNFAELIFKFIYYNDEEEKMYLLNVFSLQMIDTPCVCRFSEVGRLPEGSTTLPEGFSFKYIRVDVE